MTEPTYKDTLLEFPCQFPIKVMGRDDDDFRTTIIGIVAAHARFDPRTDVREQLSKNKHYVSVTITFEAQSKIQVDNIYLALHKHEQVMMVF